MVVNEAQLGYTVVIHDVHADLGELLANVDFLVLQYIMFLGVFRLKQVALDLFREFELQT